MERLARDRNLPGPENRDGLAGEIPFRKIRPIMTREVMKAFNPLRFKEGDIIGSKFESIDFGGLYVAAPARN